MLVQSIPTVNQRRIAAIKIANIWVPSAESGNNSANSIGNNQIIIRLMKKKTAFLIVLFIIIPLNKLNM